MIARLRMIKRSPDPDLAEAQRFLDVLGIDEPLFQTFDDKRERKDDTLVRVLTGTLMRNSPALKQINDRGGGIFALLNKHDGGLLHRRDNIVAVRAIPCDLDGAPLEPVRQCRLRPHLIVESSPDRYHCYWLAEQGFPPDMFEPTAKAVAKRFDGDSAIAKLTLVVRLPGFDNCKREQRFHVRIIEINDLPPYSADEIAAEFPPQCDAHKSNQSRTSGKRQASGAGGKRKQADQLIEIAGQAALFHDGDTAYADLMVNNHRETHPVRRRAFRRWLLREYYVAYGSAPNRQALETAVAVIEARALHDGDEHKVALRVGSHEGKAYLDLCDTEWRAVEIDAEGWRVVASPPVRFRREKGMLPLPEPATGGSLAALRPFLNLKSEDDFVLVVAWLLAALRDVGPYPVLNCTGEHGATKTTTEKLLRNLIDPNLADLRSPPREVRDLYVAANHAHIIAYDNLSRLPDWLSDALCRIATGGGYAGRALYTDDDEQIFQAIRPVMLNGISDVVTRPDLADRTILLSLMAVAKENRVTEKKLWERFRQAHPAILGPLLDAVSVGLKRMSQLQQRPLPRLADFAYWIMACEPALWPEGTFERALEANRKDVVGSVLADDVVAVALRSWIETWKTDQLEWKGPMGKLKVHLENFAGGDQVVRLKEWPKSPRAMTNCIKQLANFLRSEGIEIISPAPGDKKRTYEIRVPIRT